MDMKQYPAKKCNRKHQSKISGDKTMNTIQNPQDEVQNILSKSSEEKQALMEYAGLFASFETEVKRVLGKEAPENTEEVLAMSNDAKCKEAMDNMTKAYFAFVEQFGYSPEFACTVVDAIPAVCKLSALHMEGICKQPETEVNMTDEVKEVVKEVAEATNEAAEAATKAVEATADAVTETVDEAKEVVITAIEEAEEDVVYGVTEKVDETGRVTAIRLDSIEVPKKRELSEEEKARIKAEAEAKAKADVARLTEEARRSQNPFTAAYDFITKPFKS